MSTENAIPPGYCQCGCGQWAGFYRQAFHGRGIKRGDPKKYVFEHRRRKPFPPQAGEDYEVEDRGYESPCWVWQRALTRGYAVVGRDGKIRYVHRLMYAHFKGPIPDGLQLDHLCRTPACINPDHLEAVDGQTNVHRGLVLKLSDDDVRAIRRSAENRRVLAERFGVSPLYVASIRKRRRRADVPD